MSDKLTRSCQTAKQLWLAGSPGYIRMEAPALQDMSDRMAAAKAVPRLSLMATFPTGAFQPPFDAACISNSDVVEWLCCDSAKPGM